MVNRERRSARDAVQNLGERHPHGEEFARDVQQIEDRARHVLVVQIGRDGVRPEALRNARDGLPEPEAAGAVADVEMHAALALLPQAGHDLFLFVEQRKLLGEDVRVNIPRAKAAQNRRIAALRDDGDAVHHDALARQLGGLERAVDGGEGGMRRVLMARPVVRALEADDAAAPLLRDGGGDPRVDVGDGLLGIGVGHPLRGHVEERKDTQLRAVDDIFLEIAEIAPAARSGVDSRRHAGAQRVLLDIDGAQRVLPDVRKDGIDMAVQIAESRRHQAAGRVEDGSGPALREVFAAQDDGSVPDGDVLAREGFRLGVKDRPAPNEQIAARHTPHPLSPYPGARRKISSTSTGML